MKDLVNETKQNIMSENTKTTKSFRRIIGTVFSNLCSLLSNIYVLGLVAVTLLLGALWALLSISSVDKHEFGFVYNRLEGTIEPLGRDGYFFKPWPIYAVHSIDQRPYQIRISANMGVGDRVLNAKLVRFDPEGIEEFIDWHGRSAGDSVSNLKEIFKCYAFATDGGESCPFIKVEKGVAPITEDTNE